MQSSSDQKRRTRNIVLVLLGLSILLYKGCNSFFLPGGYISRLSPDPNKPVANGPNTGIVTTTRGPGHIFRSGFGSTGRHFSFFGG